MPTFERYSAVEMFGVPLDFPEAQLLMDGAELIKLMTDYGVEPQPTPDDITDITPFYDANANFRYFLSASEDTATVEVLPRTDRSASLEADENPESKRLVETKKRTYVLPTDQEMFAIAGFGPRYSGIMCIHELIAQRK